jgi:hypothetical protein
VLKVLNFLSNNQNLISTQGLKLIMKAGNVGDEEAGAKSNSPQKNIDAINIDFEEPGFTDLDL